MEKAVKYGGDGRAVAEQFSRNPSSKLLDLAEFSLCCWISFQGRRHEF